jgi:hypothetical protein
VSTHLRITRGRALVGGVAAASLLAMGLGVAPAGASGQLSASESAFCKTLLTFHAKEPTGSSYKSYQAWAKTYLPFWEKLASEAPSSGSRAVLNELVTVVKYEASAKNYQAIGAYIAAHETWWTNGWKAFAKDVMTCATSLY